MKSLFFSATLLFTTISHCTVAFAEGDANAIAANATVVTATAVNATAVNAIDAHFRSYFYSANIDPRKCGANIDGFIKHLGRHGLLPADFKRITLRAPNSSWHPESMVILLQGRSGRVEEGGHRVEFGYFHVIGTSNNRVYDFSFTTQPKVLSREAYFKEMFIPKKPFILFDRSFKIRGKGPYYTQDDGRSELNALTVEVMKVDKDARATTEAKYDSFTDYLKL